MASWKDPDGFRVERRRIEPSDRMTRFDWLVLVVMVALNVALLAHRVIW